MEWKRELTGLLAAAAVTAAAACGVLYHADMMMQDLLYESDSEVDDRIFVIGIDSYALDELGEWPWDRSVTAEIIETLNEDPDKRPAAIGVDIVYAGETEGESDETLLEALSAGNVVIASAAEYDGTLILEADGSAHMERFIAEYVSEPLDILADAAYVGHINAMYDTDGVLRRHLWTVTLESGEVLESFPGLLYRLYCENTGTEADFVPETDEVGFWRFEYSGQPGDYYYCSAADILSGSYDPDLLADSIVIIGPYESTLGDDFITAADRASKMYGTEYLANVTAALLNAAQRYEVSDALQLAVLFFMTFGFAALFRRMKILPSLVVLSAVLAAGMAVLPFVYHLGYVLHPLWFGAGITVSFLAGLGERSACDRAEKRKVRKVFEKYVDPQVINEVMKNDPDALSLGGRTVDIAVLFVDIRGFTSLSETLKPEEVVEILNEYLTLTGGCVARHRGTLDKFIGDCTMAFWGAPVPCGDPAYEACAAAVEMVEGAKDLEQSVLKRFGRAISFGVGVHFGPAVVGNIGAPDRMDYTAIGDTVNTSSRIESAAPGGTIYISGRVLELLGDRAVIGEDAIKLKLKGKAGEFEVFVLKGLKGRTTAGQTAGGV